MGSKINPDLVNKVKETSKQIYNKIPEKPNSIFTRKRIFIGICVILGLIIIGSFGEEEKKEIKVSSNNESKISRQSYEDIPKVSSIHLIKQFYGNNSSYSKGRLNNREIIVTGTVHDKGNDYITFNVPYQIDDDTRFGSKIINLYHIKCYFENPNEISNLSPDQKITIKGISSGLNSMDLEIKKCILIPEKEIFPNCKLSEEDVNYIYTHDNISDVKSYSPISLDRECYIRGLCEILGTEFVKEWKEMIEFVDDGSIPNGIKPEKIMEYRNKISKMVTQEVKDRLYRQCNI